MDDKKIRYRREDLIWEAVRRNENFKSDFIKLQEQIKDSAVDPSDKDGFETDFMEKWSLDLVPDDYDLPVEEILDLIKQGKKRYLIHPYADYFDSAGPVAKLYDLSGLSLKIIKVRDDNSNHKIVSEKYRSIVIGSNKKKRILGHLLKKSDNRLIVSIDPTAPKEEIGDVLLNIKKDVRRKYKDNLQTNNIKTKLYNPDKISKYIGRLKKYDEMVEVFKKVNGNNKLDIKNGVIVKPKSFSFTMMANFSSDSNIDEVQKYKDRSSESRSYALAYNEAVNLISNAPNILFHLGKS